MVEIICAYSRMYLTDLLPSYDHREESMDSLIGLKVIPLVAYV